MAALIAQNPAYTQDTEQSEKPAKADAVTMATAPPPDFKHDMEAALEFIEKNPLGFLATVDEGKPRVRAFALLKIEGDIETKREAIASMPMLQQMYAGEKEKEFEMFYLRDVELNWFGSSQAPEGAHEEMDE